MWAIKMRGRPDGLFGVVQIMLCGNENSPAKVPATVVQYRFFFFRQLQLSQGKYELRNFFSKNYRITKAIMSRVRQHHCFFMSFMFGKRIQNLRISHDASRSIRTGFSSMAKPFDSLCSKVFDAHPIVATRKAQKLCLLSTPLLKSTPRARWVTSAHCRALTIIA